MKYRGAHALLLAWALGCPLLGATGQLRLLLLDGALSDTKIIVVGERAAILGSTDNARTWQRARVPADISATLTAVTFDSTGHQGWAAGHDALIVTSTDAGASWQKSWQGDDLEESFLDILALPEERVIAVGAYGLFLRSTDAGKTWTRRKLADDDAHYNRLSRGPTGTLYIAGERGTLLRSTNQGEDWTRLVTPYVGSFFGVLPLDQRTVLAYGLRGHVFRSSDDGATWTPVTTPEPALLATGVKLKGNFLLLAGQARTLLISRDYARSFTPIPAPATAMAELLELPNGNILAIGEGGLDILPKP